MTVKELIELLKKIEDKDKTIYFWSNTLERQAKIDIVQEVDDFIEIVEI